MKVRDLKNRNDGWGAMINNNPYHNKGCSEIIYLEKSRESNMVVALPYAASQAQAI